MTDLARLRWVWIGLLVGCGCALGACGDPPAPRERPSVVLPTISGAGLLPTPRRCVDVTIRADGSLAVNGEAATWDLLDERLVAASGGHLHPAEPVVVEETRRVVVEGLNPEPPTNAELLEDLPTWPRGDDGSSAVNLVLWVEPHVPFGRVGRFLQRAAAPRIQMWRVFFAVRSTASDATRAVAVFLPKDRGLCAPEAIPDRVVHVKFLSDGDPVDVARMGAAIQTAAGQDRVAISLDWTPEVPMQRVLDAVDAALSAGAVGFVFEGGFVLDAERPGATGGTTWGVRVEDEVVRGVGGGERAGADWPAYHGFANALRVLEEEIEEETEADDSD